MWTPHYTGIDIYEGRFLYLQRNTSTKQVNYRRLIIAGFNLGWRREYKTSHFWLMGMRGLPWLGHFSMTVHDKAMRWFSGKIDCDNDWSSLVTWELRALRITLKGPVPGFLKPWARRRAEAQAEKEIREMEEAYGEWEASLSPEERKAMEEHDEEVSREYEETMQKDLRT